jgi:hypothetical protein
MERRAGAHQQNTLEWSCRHVARSAMVGERLSLTQRGKVRYASRVKQIQNGGSGSLAVVEGHSSSMAALERKADSRPG